MGNNGMIVNSRSGARSGVATGAVIAILLLAFLACFQSVGWLLNNNALAIEADGRRAIDYAVADSVRAGNEAVRSDTKAAHDKTGDVMLMLTFGSGAGVVVVTLLGVIALMYTEMKRANERLDVLVRALMRDAVKEDEDGESV